MNEPSVTGKNGTFLVLLSNGTKVKISANTWDTKEKWTRFYKAETENIMVASFRSADIEGLVTSTGNYTTADTIKHA